MASPTNATKAEKNPKPTILVVDDTPDNLTFISGLLKESYRVKVANHGEKALAIAQSSTPPDLILLDIMMPDLDGYEVCRQLKANPQTQEIPVIFLTAKAEIEDERHGLEIGAVDYITKPVSPPILMARVQTHLSLQASYKNLQNLLSFREDMVNMIVHDLRNPLNNMMLMAEVLQSSPELRPEKVQKNLDLIMRNGEKLRSLVDDLLMRAKMESGQFVLQPQDIDLCELCEAAIADMQRSAGQKNLQLITDFPDSPHPLSQIDPLLFRRIVDNLLNNAIKFSPQDSEIIIRVCYPEAGTSQLQVVDCGMGVEENLRQRIFEKYETGTLMPGISQTGLGLAFCKIAVESHGGEIFVGNNQPHGSIFTVKITNPPLTSTF